MKLITTERFVEDYRELPAEVRKHADRKPRYLVDNIAHPSLRVKRVRRHAGICEGSVNMDYRFLFQITTDAYIQLRIGRHDILDRP